ncbi:tyrosine-type recombinase/integrase [Clostridium phoceensis]|uniref:tyrosine-type recombinase/integrase n=1 Tax=Clostridium phoceensis TaxID=1650661 RepID=UPI000D2D9B3A|nr:tyrosine-type recombinase/integrase [Clostridium phoceensis]GBF67911.1 phage integrase SAM-like domain protein [Lawsonibacter asaccharolyticus]
MEPRKITEETLAAFARQLGEEERSPATLEKYLREVRQFAAFLGGREVTRDLAAAWREELSARQSPATVNGKLTALDRLLAFLGWEDCRVKHLRVQRQLFRDSARELSREEYARLVETARRLGRGRLSLLMETICATGIRVSEVRYITAEAVREGRTEIALKGKIRTILLPGKLCRKLEKYARQKKITSGELFLTRSGRPMSRKQIWAEMKGVCRAAGVAPSKVFPHNLRHLFARCFYRVSRDVAKLADVLGHSSIETTRIYLISTGAEHARTLDQLRLIS